MEIRGGVIGPRRPQQNDDVEEIVRKRSPVGSEPPRLRFAKRYCQGYWMDVVPFIIACSQEYGIVITATSDGTIMLWKRSGMGISPSKKFNVPNIKVKCVSISYDGTNCLIIGEEGKVLLIDFVSLDMVYNNTLEGKSSGCCCILGSVFIIGVLGQDKLRIINPHNQSSQSSRTMDTCQDDFTSEFESGEVEEKKETETKTEEKMEIMLEGQPLFIAPTSATTAIVLLSNNTIHVVDKEFNVSKLEVSGRPIEGFIVGASVNNHLGKSQSFLSIVTLDNVNAKRNLYFVDIAQADVVGDASEDMDDHDRGIMSLLGTVSRNLLNPEPPKRKEDSVLQMNPVYSRVFDRLFVPGNGRVFVYDGRCHRLGSYGEARGDIKSCSLVETAMYENNKFGHHLVGRALDDAILRGSAPINTVPRIHPLLVYTDSEAVKVISEGEPFNMITRDAGKTRSRMAAGNSGTRLSLSKSSLRHSVVNCEDEDVITTKRVLLHTSKGDIVVALYKETPLTSMNFLNLCSSGYYDGCIFHRVIPRFIIQTGDPTGTGRGGQSASGIDFEDELNKGHIHKAYSLGMANRGPNTNGSQFYITCAPLPWLDSEHTVFGYVVKGIDTVREIEIVPTGAADRPINNVVLLKATVSDTANQDE